MGVLIPVILGFITGQAFGLDFNAAIFLGLTLAATSVSISAQTLIELGLLRTRVGLGLLGAAVFDDILVILLLSFFTALVSGGSGINDLFLIVIRMLLFFTLSIFTGTYLLPKLTHRIFKLSISQGLITYGFVVLLAYGLAAELIGGMAAITGTFIAGLMFSRLPEKNQIASGIQTIAYGFFVPIFFISIGLRINVREFTVDGLGFLLAVLAISIISKVFGAGLGAKIGGMSWLESYQFGAGMVSRGEVGLIVASIGASLGLVDNSTLTVIIITILVTTLITPIMLKNAFLNPPGFLIQRPVSETPKETE
jgi:Kef-type K+ transport system membrane component KefB